MGADDTANRGVVQGICTVFPQVAAVFDVFLQKNIG